MYFQNQKNIFQERILPKFQQNDIILVHVYNLFWLIFDTFFYKHNWFQNLNKISRWPNNLWLIIIIETFNSHATYKALWWTDDYCAIAFCSWWQRRLFHKIAEGPSKNFLDVRMRNPWRECLCLRRREGRLTAIMDVLAFEIFSKTINWLINQTESKNKLTLTHLRVMNSVLWWCHLGYGWYPFCVRNWRCSKI